MSKVGVSLHGFPELRKTGSGDFSEISKESSADSVQGFGGVNFSGDDSDDSASVEVSVETSFFLGLILKVFGKM